MRSFNITPSEFPLLRLMLVIYINITPSGFDQYMMYAVLIIPQEEVIDISLIFRRTLDHNVIFRNWQWTLNWQLQ